MPEGHTIHRLAQDYAAAFVGTAPQVTSPQGKFSDSAALLTGTELTRTEAHGKHLFLGFAESWIHIHLGLFGKVSFQGAPAPPPTDTVRLRLANSTSYVDLRGPTTCALITDAENGRDPRPPRPRPPARGRRPGGRVLTGSPAVVRRSPPC
ncbi:DNA-(apurinic or apyrimidinic site) lyase OS=Streptomyces alboniger OX=132473 GN=CP975_11945 PE=3 SV=1 [Streptomyces alboniger]